MKCSEGLNNRVSDIIRIYIDHMEFAACMVFFITFFNILFVPLFITVYTVVCFCMLLFKCVNYVFLLLCLCVFIVMLCSVLCILFHCDVLCIVFLCKCVMYYIHRVST
jgi:hypothetical protein